MQQDAKLFHNAAQHQVQNRVIALRYEKTIPQRTFRMTTLWLAFCGTLIISMSAALSFAI
ncbi:hypothetical protein [Ascidiaceihabitans sp.]|uniref:hypothetical protein n=1 Tax=Ascidiaceihabitans sp. TaxID=1872644 RepID=UPI0032976B14